MTREEIKDFCDMKVQLEPENEDIYKAIVKILEQEPTTKKDLAVDCISRDSAIKALDYDIKSFEFKSGASKHMEDIAKLLNTIYEIQVNNIKALSLVTPQEPRKGHWEHGKELCKEYQGRLLVDVTYEDWHCSNCNYAIKGTVKPKWNYCPNCGCRMVDPQESEV